MNQLSIISDTLFIPLIGRIKASEKYPNILFDEKVLSLKDKIPSEFFKEKQTEYTILASTSRAVNVDHYINKFIEKYNDTVIIELGCGFETTYYRANNKPVAWYGLDLPEVIESRNRVFGKECNINFISDSMFNKDWMKHLEKYKNHHLLFIAAGVFHYFSENEIINLLKSLKQYFNNAFVVFDALNSFGIKSIKRYMKKLGHKKAKMYFYVDDEKLLLDKISDSTELIEEKAMYKDIKKNGLKMMTKITMRISDLMHMVKMINIKL